MDNNFVPLLDANGKQVYELTIYYDNTMPIVGHSIIFNDERIETAANRDDKPAFTKIISWLSGYKAVTSRAMSENEVW